jgi:hypothetical protein
MADAARSQVLRELEPLIRALELVDNVVRVTAFRSIVRPPTARFSSYLRERQERSALEVPNFDVKWIADVDISRSSLGSLTR